MQSSIDPPDKRHRPIAIAALIPTTPSEEAIFKLGESRSIAKKALAAQSLLSHHPNEPESALIHRIWLQRFSSSDSSSSTPLPANTTSMSSTNLKTASIMQPQYRNRHQFQIFGGFLLKATFELAFCCAASFAHARPVFVAADPCTFLNPVPVGSVLYLSATVAYTDSPVLEGDEGHALPQGRTRVQIRVESKVRDVEHGTAKPTGQFHYTFDVEKDVRVRPQTYQEFMLYLEARRRVLAHRNEVEKDSEPRLGGLTE